MEPPRSPPLATSRGWMSFKQGALDGSCGCCLKFPDRRQYLSRQHEQCDDHLSQLGHQLLRLWTGLAGQPCRCDEGRAESPGSKFLAGGAPLAAQFLAPRGVRPLCLPAEPLKQGCRGHGGSRGLPTVHGGHFVERGLGGQGIRCDLPATYGAVRGGLP